MHEPKKERQKFDPALSLELDRATVAVEDARTNGDQLREEHAREWLRKVEDRVFGEGEA